MGEHSGIKYGKRSVLPPGPIDHSQVKVQISIKMDGDVLRAARRLAEEEGIGYQTLINRALRESLLGEESSEDKMRRIAREEIVNSKRRSA